MTVSEIVAGSSGKDFVFTLTNSLTGLPLNLTGYTVRLQGFSEDLPAKTLDVAGTLSGTPTDGTVTFSQGGNLIAVSDLAGKAIARYICRIKFIDAGAKPNFGPLFELDWVAQPI